MRGTTLLRMLKTGIVEVGAAGVDVLENRESDGKGRRARGESFKFWSEVRMQKLKI